MPTPDPAAPSADRPPVSPVAVRRWVCCHCGGTGLTGDGATCPHCHGHGHD
ncbi:hypothetical protein SAMN04489712_12831 [Thermomonospora echinospora]|uniref:Uncharacterized protein n=1 Tax=Thermomonospora echinospora TaxID=1992 RepID=A0A1H6E1P8_9ACTN|nr:hypothetical protein [Thermomonospora echinospora]SEG91084.1 hypothetical protein SAMN04489712_12831 [Thermomonospora echinospora]